MSFAHVRVALLALVAALVAAPLAAQAQGQPKKKKVKPACGLRALPFAEGTQWTYDYFVPEGVQMAPGVRIQEPPTLTVKVLKVEKSGDKTLITVEESYRKVVTKNQLTCDKAGLVVPPESFFFAGQPGGGLLMTLGTLERKSETNVFAGGGFKGEAFEELKFKVTRASTPDTGATMVPASMEVERKLAVHNVPESVETAKESVKATRLIINLTGRATLDNTPDKPFNMPQLDVAMYFLPDVGVVQVRNSNGHGWKLNEYKTPE